ncbi:uncharacterized protein LOC100576023 [Acyrthosiphon pisum]|uniref:Uncharacterized protein n=1 Tax=Acyrthosiphon pisum TaxID=7029 RepID=A0A8R2B765_ACYPI|nr:uncharacterized protein LOC100576023 [Acyrthosiphon pisum]|eukprot:XP_008184547.2 PREDICTED: uncharacterized protein LOC100576023 [Acyrthosiphon pisum]
MLKTCYGLCSLRTGVKCVAFYELICTILFFLSVFVYETFSKIHLFHDDVDIYYFLQSCIIIITLLKLFGSVSLMQSTFQNAPSKIFIWIVIACIVYLTAFIVSIKMYIHKVHRNKLIAKSADSVSQLECHLLLAFILINFLSIVEIHVVASYYRQEKHLEEVEQCTRTHAAVLSSMKTHGDLENMFIYDVSRALPINRSSASEVDTLIFTSFKGVPV